MSEESVTELRGGELKVWYIPQIGAMSETFEYPVPDLATAKHVLEAICLLALFEFENSVKPDFANAGGVARFEGGTEDGEWCDVDDDELAEVSA